VQLDAKLSTYKPVQGSRAHREQGLDTMNSLMTLWTEASRSSTQRAGSMEPRAPQRAAALVDGTANFGCDERE